MMKILLEPQHFFFMVVRNGTFLFYGSSKWISKGGKTSSEYIYINTWWLVTP